jgi:hypothetical protein
MSKEIPSHGYENSQLYYLGFLLRTKNLQGYCKKVAPLFVNVANFFPNRKKKNNNNVATLLKISPEVLQYPVQLLHRDSVPSRTSSQGIIIFQRVVNTSGICYITNLPEGVR